MNSVATSLSTRRRLGTGVVLGASALAVSAALLGYGAYAAFTDTETSTVAVDTGQLDITLSTTAITATDLAPGDHLFRAVTVDVPAATNSGDLISAIQLRAANVVSTAGTPADVGSPTEGSVAGVALDAGANPVQVAVANCSQPWTLPTAGTAVTESPGAINAAATCAGTVTASAPVETDLATLVSTGLDLTAQAVAGTPTFAAGTTNLNLLVQLRLPAAAGNEYENATLAFDLNVNAIQRGGIAK
jgi:predicted ribosomally synthesized peptide with SipW-like signal peptide